MRYSIIKVVYVSYKICYMYVTPYNFKIVKTFYPNTKMIT